MYNRKSPPRAGDYVVMTMRPKSCHRLMRTPWGVGSVGLERLAEFWNKVSVSPISEVNNIFYEGKIDTIRVAIVNTAHEFNFPIVAFRKATLKETNSMLSKANLLF